MFKIIDKRDTKKTKKLMTECYLNDGYFVCKDPHSASSKALNYGLGGLKIISYKEFYDTRLSNAYIDEIDEYVKLTTPGVSGYSLTVGE